MQKINLIAQGILELSHREKSGRRRRQRRRRRQSSGLNYSPRRNIFRRGQKIEDYQFFTQENVLSIFRLRKFGKVGPFWASNGAGVDIN